jgi:hypothetical protein
MSFQALHMLLYSASSMRNQHQHHPLQPQAQHRRHLDQTLLLRRTPQLVLVPVPLKSRG